jgi:uncharacterized protein (DUF4415 family)
MKSTNDDDIPELTEAFWATARPAADVLPQLFSQKMAATLLSRTTETDATRLVPIDTDIIQAFEKTGSHWQTRLNQALRQVMGLLYPPPTAPPTSPQSYPPPALQPPLRRPEAAGLCRVR